MPPQSSQPPMTMDRRQLMTVAGKARVAERITVDGPDGAFPAVIMVQRRRQ